MKNDLKQLVTQLVEVEGNSSPLISCFVNLTTPQSDYLAEIETQARGAFRSLAKDRLDDFEDAYSEVKDYLKNSLDQSSRSVAIYARGGESPVLLPLQFKVSLQTAFIVDTLPHIYPLVELKDTYDRFVVVITTESEARILETAIGAVTAELIATRPELRQRVGREWTREHYKNHKRQREEQFIKEKIGIIDELLSRRGNNHLIVAGSPKMANRLTNALPSRLKDKLICTFTSNPNGGVDPIILESIRLATEAENKESHDRVALLESALLSGGLAVAGFDACRDALAGGYADMLVIDQDCEDTEAREELVRLATRSGVLIETVRDSERLARLSGAGCFLRYRPTVSYSESPLAAAV
ncbi:MAG: hypothetical protein KDN22_28970 [Verrucomicrobiae bacterium]|nr:hypothetical protein [Verrucomicrobiae bacterium]